MELFASAESLRSADDAGEGPRRPIAGPLGTEWRAATALWPVAWPGIVFWFLREAMGAWTSLSGSTLASGIDPGYWLWSASEHTSRTALALTLLVWAMIRASSGPTSGAAQYD